MPFFSPKYTNCKRFSDHFCFFGAAPRLWLGSGYVAARKSARPCVFFRYAQKNWVWPSATAFYPSAAHLIFSGHCFSSAVLVLFFWSSGLKPFPLHSPLYYLHRKS
ncbi:hypothetical protein SGRA_3585 [Saprospira grandis str. Lewin]|uniref:Uncharacterized protein n=1 Tax=Saprospira grandis (strain Lewin) TaxID=984262 RepID=H6L5Q9_SAPGL|nr:hypothetical protein SGRA_3585 [Saprospira grandis str. Lewin]